jgi:uncharacterized protein
MFIEQAFNYLYQSWRYLVGTIVIFLIWQLGTIPFAVAVFSKVLMDGGDLHLLEQDQSLLMKVLEPNLTLFLMLLSFAIGLLGLYLWLKWVHHQPMKAITTTRKNIDWKRFGFGFALIAITTVLLTGIDYYLHPESFEVQLQWGPFLILVILACLMIPLQTSFEEYLFRGYLMQGLGVMTRSRWVPLLLTSVVFGGMHFFNPEVDKMGPILMIYYIGTGLFLGVITLMDEGLELALGFHAGNNLVGALLVTADWTAFQTNSILRDISDPSAGVDAVAPVFLIYPLFLFLMARRYNWSDWRAKLIGPLRTPSEH